MAENNELAVVLRLVADQFKGELQSSRGAIGQFNDFLKDWKTQLAAAGAALFAVAKSTADFGEEALKGAQKAGTTVQTFSALSHAAKMADLDNQQLITGLKALSVNMVEAQQKTGDGEALFRRLGVSAVDAAGKLRPTEAVLLDLAEVFAKSSDGAAKTEASVKLFGKAWESFLPFMNQGREAIRGTMEEANRLGVQLSTEDAVAANQFNDELKKLEAASRGFSMQVGRELIPVLTQLLKVMGDAATGPIGKVFRLEMQGLASIFTLLNHGIKEMSMELDVFFKKMGQSDAVKKFWNDVLVQSRKNLDRDTDKRMHQIFQDQLGAVGSGGNGGGRRVDLSAPGPVKSVEKPFDQAQYAKDLVEIWNIGTRALEIQNKAIREQLDLFFRQEQLADEVIQKRDERNRAQLEVGLDNAERMMEASAQADRQERDGMVQLAQAWVEYDNQVMASTDERYTHRMDLLRATLTKETELTKDEAGRLIIAWQNHEEELAQSILSRTQLTGTERETLERQYLTRLEAVHQEFSGNIFEGWRRGMEQYVRNTDSAFGFAAQMAQRTAQFMEQNFRTFFFDVMDEKITSLKDLWQSLGNFVKQMMSQILAQLATMMAMKALTGAFSGGFGLGGLFGGGGLSMGGGADAGGLFGGLKFASGGPVLGAGNSDTVRAMLTPGEGVLNRRGMQALAQLNAGTVPSSAQQQPVIVNFHGVVAGEQPQVNVRRQFEGMVIDVLLKNRRELGFGW